MKSFAIAALLGAVSATRLNSCMESGIDGAGLTCVPGHDMLFATGMNGDEDLGQDIIMKGKPFHYNQALSQDGDEAAEKAEAKEEDKMKEADAKAAKVDAPGKKIGAPEKVSVLETVICKDHTTFYDKQAPKKDNLVQVEDEDKGVKGYESVSPEAEKVSVLDIGEVTRSNTKEMVPGPYRTAFYVQVDEESGVWRY